MGSDDATRHMAAMSHALAVAMSADEVVEVWTTSQERIAGRVERRELDDDIGPRGDPAHSNLVYTVASRRIYIGAVHSVEVVDAP